MTSSAPDVAAPTAVDPDAENFATQLWENIKGGNLGSAPVIIGLTIIVIVFSLTAQNFFTAAIRAASNGVIDSRIRTFHALR